MKSLEQIKNEKKDLMVQLKKLEKLEHFKLECDCFEYSENLLKTIECIINKVENENYICTILSKTIPSSGYWASQGHYDIDPSGCGGGWVSTGPDYWVSTPEETIKKIVIMKKYLHDFFCKFDFDSIESWTENLNKLVEEDKQICCNLNEFNALIFNDKFPYIYRFFGLLGEYRYQNNSLDITSEMLDECSEKIIKQNEKGHKKISLKKI